MNKGIIISGNLAQDHEFIYPYYRLLEEDIEVDVCMLEGKPVKGLTKEGKPRISIAVSSKYGIFLKSENCCLFNECL